MLKAIIKRSLPGFKLDVELSTNRDLLVVLGPSGSGKTMTLQCIAGLCRPDEGYIELNNRVLFDSAKGVNIPPGKRKVGFVFQNYALFPHLSVVDNIAYGIRNLPTTEATEKIKNLLALLHLEQLGDRLPRQLSAGQQQRVAIARALAPEPEIILLDEPFSALDTQLRERLELELLTLYDGFNGSMVLVTHDLTEGYRLGSRVAVFQSGNIIQHDSKEAIFGEPVNRTVARLTGVRNQMDGVVKSATNGNAEIYVPAWDAYLTVTVRRLPVIPGQRIVLGIRPEFIELAQKAGENVFSVTVLQAVESIAVTSCRFRLRQDTQGRHPLSATLAKSQIRDLRDGEECLIYLPPKQLIIMNE
ncbi:MAG: ABC transporter ATP-binding protein [Dehalococcoidia bacterium]|nr:ABC transporter ATP-binding protein [Dehalococcoidia bacterium]